ncbi:MAG: hypothetical protein K0Q79_957 [Flavipsychrobacter sp.]|jgi:hypothetical protein|nr:hypothetical protein [Flavipsychrobacter sp.]
MYCLSEQQIDYILDDIRRNGIETEDLQLNLLDHICCILERTLKEDDDFECLYQLTVKQFFKNELREIEEETINLLMFKNYYAMKKLMIVAGAISAAAFVLGSLFKIMFWPGASVLLCLAMLMFAVVFMPLMAVLKVKEKGTSGQKFATVTGALVAILFSLATLFKVQHWPGANILIFSTIGVAAFLYLPAYYLAGIRSADKKLDTIVTSVILVSGIGLLFTMVNLRPPRLAPAELQLCYNNEALVRNMLYSLPDTGAERAKSELVRNINATCEQIKSVIIFNATGNKALPANANNPQLGFYDRPVASYFSDDADAVALIKKLEMQLTQYRQTKSTDNGDILNIDMPELCKFPSSGALCLLSQLQIYLLNAEREKLVATIN